MQHGRQPKAVELGFKIPGFETSNLGFLRFFILCDLLNKSHIKILIVIYEIHHLYLHFSHVFFSFGVWTFVLSKMRRMGCFSCAFGSYFRVWSS